jgi:hypothetical protein
MELFAWLIAFGFAAALIVVAALLVIGGAQALREELLPGFRSRPPGVFEAALTLLAAYAPLAVLVVFAALFVARIAAMALAA